jgi:alpha-galactosidase
MQNKKLKISLIGAGSISFGPLTMTDIVLSEKLNSVPLELCIMDISEEALKISEAYGRDMIHALNRDINFWATTDLIEAVRDADFVVTAIEVDRYHYWSMDFHIGRRYGSRQVYGENGGPGGMFHFLRNIGPMMEIARAIEKYSNNAYLINYTNPEAKLVEAINKLTNVRTVGVCHGFEMGVHQIAEMLDMPKEDLDIVGYGLNHFGFITKIEHKKTGEDLYPKFKQYERNSNWLSKWDEIAFSRIMLRNYGLYPYPGTNHCGEYVPWADEFLASSKIQYFFDPLTEKPWETKKTPEFVYDFCSNPTAVGLRENFDGKVDQYKIQFRVDEKKEYKFSGEYGVTIIEAIAFDEDTYIPSLNVNNDGQFKGILDGMCVEGPCLVNGDGITLLPQEELPTSVTAMINVQGMIHRLLIEAYVEKSKNKLLQAVLFDPTVSNYNNSVAMINEMFEMQKEVLPDMEWQDTL